MPRETSAWLLASLVCLGFLVTAGLHGTGCDFAVRVATEVQGLSRSQ